MNKHAAKFAAYQGIFHKDKVRELKKSLSSQRLFFPQLCPLKWTVIKVSYVVANQKKNQNHFLMVSLLINVCKVQLIKFVLIKKKLFSKIRFVSPDYIQVN